MPLLSMSHISKRFGAVQALQDVSLTLEAGEVLGIVGENGAGKSTLIKILGGVHRPDEGTIVLDGQPVAITTPQIGLQLGIALIYQELSLVPELSVAENLFLGDLPRRAFGFVDRKQLIAKSRQLLKRVELAVEPNQRVANLRIDARQLIEVGKALSRHARVLVMDEPTSSLNEKEIQHLFTVIRNIKAQGTGIIYISHYLDEVQEICDRVMVLRDGREVDTRPTAAWNHKTMVQAMVDRPIENFYPKVDVSPGEVVLEVAHLGYQNQVQDVTFQVRAGEIVGLAGLPGSGHTTVAQIIAGIMEPTAGTMKLQGQPFRPVSPATAIANQVGYVPEDRKEKGLFLEFSIRRNVTLSILPNLANMGIIDNTAVSRVAEQAMKDYRIKAPHTATPVKALSGGNQQKVLLARVGQIQPALMVMNDPTRGIDVGAKVEVYERMGEFAQKGGAVLFLSSEMPELIGISDRILVIREGRLVAEVPRHQFSQHLILTYATSTNGGNGV